MIAIRIRRIGRNVLAKAVATGLSVVPIPAFAAHPDPLSGLSIHHVQVSVRDADALAAWYVDTLHFRVVKRVAGAGIKIVWIDIPGFRLGLAELAGSVRDPSQSIAPPADVRQQGYRQIHFSVASVDDAYRALMMRGVPFTIPPTSFAITGIRLATLRDPEGNVISLYQDIDLANPPVSRAVVRHQGNSK